MAEISVDLTLRGVDEGLGKLRAVDQAATAAAGSTAALGTASRGASGGVGELSAKAAQAANGATAIGSAAGGASTGLKSMGSAAAVALGPLTALVAAGASLSAVFGNIVEFDKLSGQVKTVTGDAQSAAVAMEGLRSIATQLPVELGELTASFVLLQSRGFDTTAASMRAISDTAAALGKGFQQTAEAIADLAVGQSMRMEELGISVTQNNGKVQLSFGKTAVEVERSAEAIQGALDKIALENFAGASAEQMERLTGKISNLQDAFANLSVTLGEVGVYTALSSAIGWATSAIASLAQGMAELSAIAGTTWAILRRPWDFSAEVYKLEGALTQIEQRYAGVGDSATKAYDEQSRAATDSMRVQIAANNAKAASAAAADAAAKQSAKEAESAAKAAASAAKAQAEAIARQVAQQTQAVETYSEALSRQLAEYAALAEASKGAFGGEALIRSQTAALSDYGKAVDTAYAAEIKRAQAGVQQADGLYEQIAANERLAELYREIADSKASNALELASEGLISNEAAARAAGEAWAEYRAAVEGTDLAGIVADWSRLNDKIGATNDLLKITAEDMLYFGIAADSVTNAVGGILGEINKIPIKAKKDASIVASAWDEAARSIQRSLGDSFYNALDKGIDSFRDFGDAVVDIMKRAAADIAAALVFEAVFKGGAPTLGSIAGSAVSSGAASGVSMASIGTAISGAAATVTGAISSLGASIGPALTGIMGSIGPAAAGIVGAIGPVGIAVAAGIAAFALFGDQIKGLIGGILDGIGNIVSGIAGAVGDLLGGIADAVGDLISGIAGAIGGAVGDVAGGVFDSVTGIVGDVVGGVGDLLGGIFHSGGIVGKTATETRSLPASTWAGAPRMHTGGLLAPDERPIIARVGEAVVPLQSGKIPVDLQGASGGGVVNVFGAPAGTRTRKRGQSTDIFIARVAREVSGLDAALAAV